MTTRATTLRTVVSLAVIASLIGCATTRVDVDVYKGPLANHEDVQMEQLAFMVISAKVLLERIRDDFEDNPQPAIAVTQKEVVEDIITLYDDKSAAAEEVRSEFDTIRQNLSKLQQDPNDTEAADEITGASQRAIDAAGYADFTLEATRDSFTAALRSIAQRSVDTSQFRTQVAIAEEIADRENLFKRGRLRDGLYALIENYNDDAHAYRLNPTDAADRTRKRSQDALLFQLVGFAEKLLFLANNNGLISDPRRSPWRFDRYVLVLQAVGNSILMQADELRQRGTHDSGLTRAAGRERRAVELAYSAEPRQVIEELLLAIQGRSDIVDTSDEQYAQITEDLTKQKETATKNQADKEEDLTPAQGLVKQAMEDAKDATTTYVQCKLAHDLVHYPSSQDATDQPLAAGQMPPLSASVRSQFRSEIDTLVNNPPANVTLYDRIGQLLSTAIATQPAAELDALKEAQKAYGRLDKNAITEPNWPGAFKQLRTILVRDLAAALVSAQEKHADLTKQRDAVAAIEGSLTQLKSEVADLEDKIEKNETKRKNANGVRYALAEIKEQRAGVIQDAMNDQIPPTARSVISELLHRLRAKRAQPGANDERMAAAIKHVESYPIPDSVPTAASTGARSSKDVLDDVIAALRQEHIKVVAQLGTDSPRARDVAAALEAAHAHRSGMVYIRPAMSYLRSSYPSTSLQGDPRLGWDNMLGRHALRNLPLIGESIENRGRRRSARIVADIDKQFWHNINSVRVSGAGNTNYVIAKDDIGNWYVKNYSADPEPIIKGAQSLAMFSLGAEMEVDLLARLRAGPGGSPNLDTSRSAYEKVLDKYLMDYLTQTNDDFEDLVALLEHTGKKGDFDDEYKNALTERIEAAWKGNSGVPSEGQDDLDGLIRAASEAHLKTALNRLNEGVIDVDNASAVIKKLQSMIHSGPAVDVKPALEALNENLRNPVRNARIFAFIESKIDVSEDKTLGKLFGELKKHLGAPDQGLLIIDALHDMRRFYRQLDAGIAVMDFGGATSQALTDANEALAAAITATADAKSARDSAEQDNAAAADDDPDLLDPATTAAALARAEQDFQDATAGEDAAKQKVAEEEAKAGASAKAAVRAVLATNVRGTLDGFVQKRLAAVKIYEDGVSFIGELTSQ